MKVKKKIHKESEGDISPAMTTREKMMARKKQLDSRGSSGIIFPKEGTLRLRMVSQGAEKELGLEVIQFYLGPKLGGVMSPATFNEPCPFYEKYNELKHSKDALDQQLAGQLAPRKRYIIAGTCYSDEKGKAIDEDRVRKAILVPRSVYQDIIDLYLDEDDWGDMTDKENGYDIKITRTGTGKTDTNYTVTACPGRKSLDEKYVKEVDLEEVIHGLIKPYNELENLLNEFLDTGIDYESGDDITKAFNSKNTDEPAKKLKVKKHTK